MTTRLATTSSSVGLDIVHRYRENGYVHIPQVLSPEEVNLYREAAREAYETRAAYNGEDDKTFKQILQLWKTDQTLRQLTLHTGLATIATQLAGVPLRLWHDQLLIKAPHNGAPTEYHQDGPYWPHAGARHQLSAWIALVDVPVERGCMTFIPGTHRRTDIRAADLHSRTDFFDAAPDVTFLPRVTVPLRAGDCTFHHAYLAHTANPNDTDDFRYAFVSIYVDTEVTYNGRPHPCTDDLGLEVGSTLPEEEFPRLPRDPAGTGSVSAEDLHPGTGGRMAEQLGRTIAASEQLPPANL
jgi:phytanoyl-CoA hydroxylase